MKFAPLPLQEAHGKILGHNVAGPDGRRRLRKGKPLSQQDVEVLESIGRKSVYVAILEEGDVDENTASKRIARSVSDERLRLSGPANGRTNLYAQVSGLLRVDVTRLTRLNAWEGITLATLRHNSVVPTGKMVATVKILPYAVRESDVRGAVAVASAGAPIVSLEEFTPSRVSLILSGSPPAQERIVKGFKRALSPRLEELGSVIAAVDYIPLEDEDDEIYLASTIMSQLQDDPDLIILAGETAIMDREDIAPRAVVRAGGVVTCYGAPVDPGNLLMLAYHGHVPIVGAPGCARSPKTNIIDLLLPRLLVGDRLSADDIHSLGHGGLLEDVPERPMPRHRLP